MWIVVLLCQALTLTPSKSRVLPSASDGARRVGSSGKIPLKYFNSDQKLESAQSWNDHSNLEAELIPTSIIEPSLIALLIRSVYLCFIFTPLMVTAPPAFWSPSFRNAFWYPLVCWSIAKGGAAWIKWAQWGSTRPDILPEQLCAHLATLQTSAPEHHFSHTRAEIEQTFGLPLEDVFSHFDPRPVASGSIAQVHFALYEGQRVAVKVRHPGVARQLNLDFRVMKAAAHAAASVPGLKWLNLEQSVEAFSHTMTGQTLLTIEANHLALFNAHFQGWGDVFFPKPIVASDAVLVESFESGRLVSDFTGLNDLIQRTGAGGGNADKAVATEHGGQGEVRRSTSSASASTASTSLVPVGPIGGSVVAGRSDNALTTAHSAVGVAQPLASSSVSLVVAVPASSYTASLSKLPLDLAHFVVTRGEDLYLKMLLLDGLMHADLHPGNILLDFEEPGGGPPGTTPLPKAGGRESSSSSGGGGRGGTGPSGARIVLVDAGMVASLSPEEQEHFIGLLENMGRGDGPGAAQHVLKFSTEQTCTGAEEQAAFLSAMARLFESSCRGYGTGIDLATVLRGVLSLVRDHAVRVDVNYATLVMNALCLDGLAKALLPDYNIMDAAAPLLRAHGRFHTAGLGKSAVGRGFLRRVAIPLAMRRKRLRDRKVSRRLSRLGVDGVLPLSPATEAIVRRLLAHKV